MSLRTVQAWQCDYFDCGHIWLAVKLSFPPSHCAKCRKRGWNMPKVQSVVREAEKDLTEAGVAPYAPKEEVLSDVPHDPDGVRRKCMVHRKFFDLCRATACVQEHQNILERLGLAG